jgi:hypothetical protein
LPVAEAREDAQPRPVVEPPQVATEPPTSPPDPPPAAQEPAPEHEPEAGQDPPPKRVRTSAPRSDADIIADVRSAAGRSCRAEVGAAEITVEFLIERGGRPALLRASPAGDPRSDCVKATLRRAEFSAGTDRRASFRVLFER